jgi:hypothetical protein
MQTLMSNFVVVWTVCLAFIYLRTRFHQVHIIGCVLIVISVFVGVADKLETNDCSPVGLKAGHCLTSYTSVSGEQVTLSASSTLLWYSFFLLGTVPNGISNVYKQSVLQSVDLDVCYATWWSGNFQVLWGLLMFWMNWIPLPDQKHYTPSDTWTLMSETWGCFTGAVACSDQAPATGLWHSAMFWFGVYLCFNLSFNVLLLWLTKRMSAAWAQVATTLCLDLTNIFSQSTALMGASAKAMTICQWLATLLASVALWAYNLESEKKRGSEDKDDVPATGTWQAPSMVSDARASLVESLSFRPERPSKERSTKHRQQATV